LEEPTGRRPKWMTKRKEFTASIKAAVRERSNFTCEYPECGTYPATEVDHVVPEALGGPSTIDNAMLLCTACHARKTALDVKLIAKADRQGGRSGQYARRKRRGGSSIPAKKNAWPAKGTRKLQSRGFNRSEPTEK
jgi:5-methylcytosine-specific restriction endonuclease McrA